LVMRTGRRRGRDSGFARVKWLTPPTVLLGAGFADTPDPDPLFFCESRNLGLCQKSSLHPSSATAEHYTPPWAQ
jgi:hypothetical protein